jgi:hypothetical protein
MTQNSQDIIGEIDEGAIEGRVRMPTMAIFQAHQKFGTCSQQHEAMACISSSTRLISSISISCCTQMIENSILPRQEIVFLRCIRSIELVVADVDQKARWRSSMVQHRKQDSIFVGLNSCSSSCARSKGCISSKVSSTIRRANTIYSERCRFSPVGRLRG